MRHIFYKQQRSGVTASKYIYVYGGLFDFGYNTLLLRKKKYERRVLSLGKAVVSMSVFDKFSKQMNENTKITRAELLEQLKQFRSELEEMNDSSERLDSFYEKKFVDSPNSMSENMEYDESDGGEEDSPDSIGQKVLSYHR